MIIGSSESMRGGTSQKAFGRALLIGLSLVSFAQAQMGSDDGLGWRRIPQQLRAPDGDTVAADVRAARDEFFDRVIGALPPGQGSSWDKGAIFEEIPVLKSITIAVVRFESYTTIQSASKRSIYTEVKMQVEQALRDPSTIIRPGQSITVILGGGSLRLPSGRVIQRDLDLGDYGIEPGHRYLAFLAYERAGTYFSWLKSWDLTSGLAVPTEPFDVQKAHSGMSRFAGMPEDKFIVEVNARIASAAK
jgi:hypothetical protein